MLISEHVAIVPLGINCLQAFQIRWGREKLSRDLGCEFQETSSFFQWIFQDPRYVATLIEKYVKNGEKITPDDLEIGLTTHREQVDLRFPFMPATNTWFMHEGVAEGAEEEKKKTVCEKYNYLFSKIRKLFNHDKRYFIFGNGDPTPMEFSHYKEGKMGWYYTCEDVENISKAINEAFPEGENIIVFVPNDRNMVTGLQNAYMFPVENATSFEGYKEAYTNIFSHFPKLGTDSDIISAHNRQQIGSWVTFPKKWDARNEKFLTHPHAVARDHEKFKIDTHNLENKEDILIWGPYLRLSTGRYRLEFVFDSEDASGSALLEVTSEGGQYRTVSTFINGKRLEKFPIVELYIAVGEDLHRVEFRLQSQGDFSAILREIRLIRL